MDKTDPICGMKGHIRSHGRWFCSENCIRKYEKLNKLKKEPCPSCAVKAEAWYKEKLLIVSAITFLILAAAYYIPRLNPVYSAFMEYFNMIWWAIVLGLLIGGFIDRFIPEEYIAVYLSGKNRKTIFNAVILGFFMSACSHGILAIAIQLYKKGASVPAVISFLLASPWANLPITIMLFAFFGFKALFLVLAALLIALTTGFIYQFLDKKGLIEKTKQIKLNPKFSIKTDIKKRWKTYNFNLKDDLAGVLKSAWSLAKMVLWWIIIGMLLASLGRTFVPEHIFHQYMGPTLLGLLGTLIAATIIEVCSEGSSPIAFEIFRQTGAFGNSFVFLLAGVATDYTEIGLIWSNIGKRSALWLPVVTVPQVLIIGYVFNLLL